MEIEKVWYWEGQVLKNKTFEDFEEAEEFIDDLNFFGYCFRNGLGGNDLIFVSNYRVRKKM